jgi:methionyl-tRNA synthetase
MAKKFYIVTSIPYVNAKPHLGHTLDVLYGDVLARYYRKKGFDVILQAGLDENGQKLYQKACEQGKTPKEWIEELRPVFIDFFRKLEISYDVFTNTSEKKHWKSAQELWIRAEKNGDIYKKKYRGLYCIGCESFKLSEDLIDGKCPDHQTEPENIEEENYFFALKKYEGYLKKLFKENPDFVFPKNSYNEALKMIEGGLEDVSISRPKLRLPWGVPVPNDPDHVMYVWFDALTNYLTALDFPENTEKMDQFWPPDIEIVGKDNNRWHTLLWPAMLKSGGLKPPKKVLVHYYVLGKGNIKMSKTIGNVLDPVEMMDKYGADPFRYYMLTRVPISSDGSFDEAQFDQLYQSELGNDLGNLLQRTISMINKYEVKVTDKTDYKCFKKDCLGKHIENLEFDQALEKLWGCVRKNNKYIEDEKPWELAKSDPEKLTKVLQEVYNFLNGFSDKIYPFMPETAEKMRDQLKTLKPEPLFPRIEER